MNKSSKLLKKIWNQSKTVVRHYCYPTEFRQFLENNYPGAQHERLESGLMVATEERPDWPCACVGFYIDGGSRYESDFENGMAHFFEHVAFKSTRMRNKMQLHNAMDYLAATFGCFTTREMVCYYFQCPPGQVPDATQILIDCVFNNGLLPPDIEAQKKVVYSEMLEHDQDYNELAYDYLHSAAFQGTSLEKTVMGPSTNLYNFDQTTLALYLNRLFVPHRSVLASCGAVKHEKMVQLALRFLNKPEIAHCPPSENQRFTGAEVRYRDDSSPMGNIIMAVEGPSFTAEENICMEIAKYAVGSWDRSQLIDGNMLTSELAKSAASYHCDSFKSFNITYRDIGLWGIQFLADGHSLDDMSIAVQKAWMYLCLCITKPELDRAKRFYKCKLLSEMQTAKGTCHDLGRWALYKGCRPSLLDRISLIESVTVEDMREVASLYIYNKCPVVTAIGQVEGLMEYQRLRGQMYWLRY